MRKFPEKGTTRLTKELSIQKVRDAGKKDRRRKEERNIKALIEEEKNKPINNNKTYETIDEETQKKCNKLEMLMTQS